MLDACPIQTAISHAFQQFLDGLGVEICRQESVCLVFADQAAFHENEEMSGGGGYRRLGLVRVRYTAPIFVKLVLYAASRASHLGRFIAFAARGTACTAADASYCHLLPPVLCFFVFFCGRRCWRTLRASTWWQSRSTWRPLLVFDACPLCSTSRTCSQVRATKILGSPLLVVTACWVHFPFQARLSS